MAAETTRNDRFRASLDRRQESPAEGRRRARGRQVHGDPEWLKLKRTLTFKFPTGKATAAHIHSGKRGKAGIVLIPLCGPCRSGVSGTVATSQEVDAMKKGNLYVNVHTVKNPAGEIRGQLHG